MHDDNLPVGPDDDKDPESKGKSLTGPTATDNRQLPARGSQPLSLDLFEE